MSIQMLVFGNVAGRLSGFSVVFVVIRRSAEWRYLPPITVLVLLPWPVFKRLSQKVLAVTSKRMPK